MADVIDILKKINAIVTNSHFVYTSGRHGNVYIRKDLLYPHIKETSQVCQLFAEKFKERNVDMVVGPSIGGIILSTWTAHHLSRIKDKEILSLFTEKDENENQVFKRGYDEIVKGKNVVIVEDLTTTGGSVKKVADSVRFAGGNVLEVCVMINRDPEKVTKEVVGESFSWLGVFPAESFDEKDCPLCTKGIPVNTTVGHGKKFLQGKSK